MVQGIAKAVDVWYDEVAFVALMSILMRSTRLLGNCPVAIFFGAACDAEGTDSTGRVTLAFSID
jgi:hypothetical protein